MLKDFIEVLNRENFDPTYLVLIVAKIVLAFIWVLNRENFDPTYKALMGVRHSRGAWHRSTAGTTQRPRPSSTGSSRSTAWKRFARCERKPERQNCSHVPPNEGLAAHRRPEAVASKQWLGSGSRGNGKS